MSAADVASPFSPYRTDGKLYGFICVVTGALQPIGQAILTELATHGAACIYACTRSESEDASPVLKSLAESHPNTKIIPYPLSLSDEQATLALIDDVLNAWGRLDVWVTSSGLLAPFFALKYAPPAMGKLTPKGHYPNAAEKDVKYGSIIVVSSVASTYGGTGVRINCISPGQIDVGVDLKDIDMRGMTYQLPPASLQTKESQKDHIGLERAGVPTEVARVAGFLASGFSSYMTGSNLVVDGGARYVSLSLSYKKGEIKELMEMR
ncbi:hypothetical protein G7Y79_00036g072050 [Physcia stellaris]|nr:hypothetical protein G7Y79_00036g072050 [Physcia stellaris]